MIVREQGKTESGVKAYMKNNIPTYSRSSTVLPYTECLQFYFLNYRWISQAPFNEK